MKASGDAWSRDQVFSICNEAGLCKLSTTCYITAVILLKENRRCCSRLLDNDQVPTLEHLLELPVACKSMHQHADSCICFAGPASGSAAGSIGMRFAHTQLIAQLNMKTGHQLYMLVLTKQSDSCNAGDTCAMCLTIICTFTALEGSCVQ